jgi:helix-turn-helix protein
MTVGEELGNARRHLGLTLDALSSTTGLPSTILRSIEETDISRLPSRAALDRAIRVYAAAVDLDPDELSERYLGLAAPSPADAMTAFESEDTEPPPASATALFACEPPSELPQSTGTGLFVYEPAYAPAGRRQQAARPAGAGDLQLPLHPEQHADGPSAIPHAGRDSRVVPEAGRRDYRLPIAAIALVSAIAVVGGYVLSARGGLPFRDRVPRASDRAVTSSGGGARPAEATAQRAAAAASPPTSSATTPRPTSPAAPAAGEPSAIGGSPVTPEPAKTSPVATREERPTSPENPNAKTATGRIPSAFVAVPGAPAASAPSAPPVATERNELSGSWEVIAHDAASTPERDANRIAYYLRLEQRGTQIVGSGYRVTAETAQRSSSQQAVTVQGTLTGTRLTLNFTGQRRERVVLNRSDDGMFRGQVRRDPSSVSLVVTLSPRGQKP